MCELRREIVQRGLDLRKAKRQEEARQREEAQREATLEAYGEEMRREINFHARFQQAEKEAAERNERRDRREANRRANRRAQEAKRAYNWHTYIMRNFWSVFAATVVYLLDMAGAVHIAVSLPLLILAGAFCIVNYIAFATRNCKAQTQTIKGEG